jgi:hypothetical protein
MKSTLMRELVGEVHNRLIACTYRRWSDSERQLARGYTILLPIPSDLPVFLALALEIISKQDLTGLKEVLVIPDWPSVRFAVFCKKIVRTYSGLPIRSASLGLKDRLAWALTKGIIVRHFTRVVRGIDELRTDHAIIHDVDLFLRPGDFLKTQYEACRDGDLAVYGVEPRRSMARQDRDTFVATWEMTFSTKWAKSFRPCVHKGQSLVIAGRRQEFDTMLLPQYLTDEKLIDWGPKQSDFFHFRYVVASYRNFVNGKVLPKNYGLKLFLIRTLIDAFDVSGWHYGHVPRHDEFLQGEFGLSDLRSDPDGIRLINEFKGTLGGIIDAGIFSQHRSDMLRDRLTNLLQSMRVHPD